MRRRDICAAAAMAGAALSVPGRLLSAAASPPPVKSDLAAITLSGKSTTLARAALQDFRNSLRGGLVLPGDAEYNAARRVWNAMIDRRPALVARCADADDVVKAVNFARAHELLLAVRGGGHSFSGQSTCDGGMVIDLSSMRTVRVDDKARIAYVAGGAWGRDVDAATQRHGLATTLGQISDTGVGGLTLGGGFGWLSRRFGLACDNVIAAELITADGQRRRVSAEENPDLYWAIRGGGGNFGVVTAFEYRLHPVGPRVVAGSLTFAPQQMRDAIELFAERVPGLPRELSTDFGISTTQDGMTRAHVVVCYSGQAGSAARALAPLRGPLKPLQDTIASVDYTVAQQFFDGPHPSKTMHYVKGGFVREFSAGLIDELARFRPDGFYGLYMQDSSGAVGDIEPTATAFAHRKTRVNMMLLGEWSDKSENDHGRKSVRDGWAKIAPFTEGFYVNLSDADKKQTTSNFGPNHARLVELKRKYDPTNLFRLNSNIDPAA